MHSLQFHRITLIDRCNQQLSSPAKESVAFLEHKVSGFQFVTFNERVFVSFVFIVRKSEVEAISYGYRRLCLGERCETSDSNSGDSEFFI